ncbi:MAG: ATP phosphoribosyltransferase, partial [Oscillospiraceae bacterium]|nr:ATP phosphoribosyltransferase [Oscillospiraceae bacterium]
MINVALPKGRLGSSAYKLFEKLGCGPIEENTRKLKFTDEKTGLSFFWVKPSDVAIYVERGAADIGICGRDILLEEEPDVFELLDLGIGKCRMCVAGYADRVENPERPLRVATKFPNIAREYYSGLSREIDIIKLNGSIELAPIMGLSDVIVDIVESGATLR